MLGIVRGLIRKYPELKSECTKDKYARPLRHPFEIVCRSIAPFCSADPLVCVWARCRGGLVGQVFEQCLFALPTAEEHGPTAPPKCKTVESRTAAFSLLTELVRFPRPTLAG